MSSVIQVDKLSKTYRVSHQLARNTNPTLRDDLKLLAKKPLAMLGAYHGVEREMFWALKNISFNIEQGEVVGLMGRNGSGKSTLFKILSKITFPSSGEAIIHGRVGSLLEVGTGFHPELTGRENVYFNGSVLGMKKKEINKKFDDIVAFSEVEKFLDTPVKHYSSGMKVRLAFSVAAHIEPEILLIDEVLAVGDVKFKQKSIEKMKQVAKDGTTILFVSHIISQIEQICDRGIVLHDGLKKYDGSLAKAIDTYLDLNAVDATEARDEDHRHIFTGQYKLSNVQIETRTKDVFPDLSIKLQIENLIKKDEAVDLDVIIYDDLGRGVASISNRSIAKELKLEKAKNKLDVDILVKNFNVVPDRYNVRLILRPAADRSATYHLIEKAATFKLPEYVVGAWGLKQRGGNPPPVVLKYDYEVA
jgi:ABC-type polysaccharide/polyol phosphate transport system ATPase subunit